MISITFVGFVGSSGLLACNGNRPSWEGLNKASRVGIVDHGHGAKRVIEGTNEAFDLNRTAGSRTEIEDLRHICVSIGLRAEISKLFEAGLDHVGALSISLTEIVSCNIIVSIRANVALEEKNGGASCKGTLEDMRVLHTEPG